ncbi:MAG: site-2 protease family protein [Candidatus Dojkabacteria bacterium]|nr:site-2 protease family protein [Candidatus Dojkabacteria bacterium]
MFQQILTTNSLIYTGSGSVESSLLYVLFVWIGIFFSIVLHEFAHAYTAVRLGDLTPKYEDRLTINPFKHFDLIGFLLIFFAGFGYGKPVMINPNNLSNPKRDMMIIAIAGPLVNIFISLAVIFIYAFLSIFFQNSNSIVYFMFYTFVASLPAIGVINLFLAIFNMLPIPPLDGSKVFRYISYRIADFIDNYIEPYALWILIILILPIWGDSSILRLIAMPFLTIYLFVFEQVVGILR